VYFDYLNLFSDAQAEKVGNPVGEIENYERADKNQTENHEIVDIWKLFPLVQT
jgi:hypothetical protein